MKAQGDMSCQKKKSTMNKWCKERNCPPPAIKKGSKEKKKLFEFFRKRECTPVRYNLKALKWTQQHIKKKKSVSFFFFFF